MSEGKNNGTEQNDFLYHLLYLPRGVDRLMKLGTVKKVPANTIINEIDAVPEFCYVLKSGSIVCYESSYTGDQRIYNIMEEGSLLMEDCVLFDKPCPVLFKTMEDCEVVAITKCNLKRAFKKDIDVVIDICESLATKFLSAMEQIRLGPRQSASWKLCKFLMICADHYGEQMKDGTILIRKKISHQMFADLLGMNRVTITRKFKELKDRGILDTENGKIRFLDIKKLKEYMRDLEE